MQKAVYAGSFDPLTLGHMQLIEDASNLFEFLYVAIGVNPAKKSMFTVEERLQMVKESTAYLGNVEVTSFTNMYLVDYCHQVHAEYYVRGLRNEDDYRFEKSIVNINRSMNSVAQPVWLPAATQHEHVSSSVVKGLIGPEGWEDVVAKYVPAPVLRALLKRTSPKNDQ